MIPKKIHYFWMSDGEMPQNLVECLDSWRKFMPDYELVKWDESRLKEIDSVFVEEAIREKKWAFASDYVRLHALYHEGGIYFDTDVMVFKSFDDLLELPAFIGSENVLHVSRLYTPRCLTSFCMGTEPGNPFFKKAMDYYKDRRFIRSEEKWLPEDLRYEITVNSYILMEIARTFGYDPKYNASFPQELSCGMKVFAPQYFNPIEPVEESYCEHRAAGSWREREYDKEGASLKAKVKKKIRRLFLDTIDKTGLIIMKKR